MRGLGQLPLAVPLQRPGRGGALAVAVDGHAKSSSTVYRRGINRWRYTESIAISRLRRFASMPYGFISGLPAALMLSVSRRVTSSASA